MAIIKRSKNQILGLSGDLAALQDNINYVNQAQNDNYNSLQLAITSNYQQFTQDVAGLDSRLDAVEDELDSLDVSGSITAAIAGEVQARDAAIEQAISNAQLNIGKDFKVADNAAKDALAGLAVNDRVLVEDDGDSKWAVYQVVGVVGGAAIFLKIIDQDSLTNALSAAAIKQAYESNGDTNAFTDALKAKLDLISVTEEIDLDIVLTEDYVTNDDTFIGASNNYLPTALAVKTYVDAAVAQVEQNVQSVVGVTETVPVTSDRISLSQAPALILNFVTARHVDEDNVAYDIPLVADSFDPQGRTFILAVDTAGQFNSKNVVVQYLK